MSTMTIRIVGAVLAGKILAHNYAQITVPIKE